MSLFLCPIVRGIFNVKSFSHSLFITMTNFIFSSSVQLNRHLDILEEARETRLAEIREEADRQINTLMEQIGEVDLGELCLVEWDV